MLTFLKRTRSLRYRHTIIILVLILLTLFPASKSSATPGRSSSLLVAADVPQPLPRDCDGINPPDWPDPCCAFGYAYYNDEPVDGASVYIESLYGSHVTTTTVGEGSNHPYYSADLSSAPLSVSPGDTITITVAYSDMVSIRTWTVQSNGQQVDLGLIIGYQATEAVE